MEAMLSINWVATVQKSLYSLLILLTKHASSLESDENGLGV